MCSITAAAKSHKTSAAAAAAIPAKNKVVQLNTSLPSSQSSHGPHYVVQQDPYVRTGAVTARSDVVLSPGVSARNVDNVAGFSAVPFYEIGLNFL